MSLCRQLGIDVGLLFYTPPGQKLPNPWVCAALIEGKLYLFDPRIGLPIPGRDGTGVATLDDALADPMVLDRLDLPGQSSFGRIPKEIVAKRQKLVQTVNDTEVLPFAPVGSLIIDDPELAAWTHRQLTPHPVACYTKPIRLDHPAGNGRPMTYIACTSPRYPVSAGMHEKVQAMPNIRFRSIAAGHNCILSAPDLVAGELLAIPA